MKNVLITGSSSGIGFATTKMFLENNYHVFGVDIQTNAELSNIANYHFFQASITSNEDLLNISNYLQESKILLDMIINIASNRWEKEKEIQELKDMIEGKLAQKN